MMLLFFLICAFSSLLSTTVYYGVGFSSQKLERVIGSKKGGYLVVVEVMRKANIKKSYRQFNRTFDIYSVINSTLLF